MQKYRDSTCFLPYTHGILSIMKRFDSNRPEFSPYGFTCERWTPAGMPRPDRHNEIEVNLLGADTLTHLFGGRVVVGRIKSSACAEKGPILTLD